MIQSTVTVKTLVSGDKLFTKVNEDKYEWVTIESVIFHGDAVVAIYRTNRGSIGAKVWQFGDVKCIKGNPVFSDADTSNLLTFF